MLGHLLWLLSQSKLLRLCQYYVVTLEPQEYLYRISNLCEAICNLKCYFCVLDTVFGYHIYDWSSRYRLISVNKYAYCQRQVVSLLPVYFFLLTSMYVLYVHVVVLQSLCFSFLEREVAVDLGRSSP